MAIGILRKALRHARPEPANVPAGTAAAAPAEAAVLVVDVSGFTALTVALEAEKGARAADSLAMVMDGLLGAFADIVDAHDGTVIDVVGDSVQAIWPAAAEPGGDRAAMAQAALAALAMIAHVETAESRDKARGTAAKLPVRVGLGFGVLLQGKVGGEGGHWDRLAWGPALFDAADSTVRAGVGTIAVHDRAAALVEPAFAGEARTGYWELQGARPGTTAFAPALTASQVRDGDAASAWAAELRSASILFVRLFRIDELGQASFEQVHRRVVLVQKAIAPHGGQLDKVHADEKGIAAVVAFGLPPMPIADAALRMLAAAVDLRAELRDLGIDVAIGVATGRVRAGIGGAYAAAQHTIYGGAANLAARCMQACRDEILGDAATRAQAGDAFEFFAPEAHALKGIGPGVEIFGVGNPRQRQQAVALSDATPIAGRAGDIARIEHFVVAPAGDSYPRLLLLDGEVGIGKSRLAAHAASFAVTNGTALLVARAGPMANRTPLFAWRDPASALLRDWARGQSLRLGEAQAALTRAAGEDPKLAPLTNPLFGRESNDLANDAVSGADGRPRLARRLQALVLATLLGDNRRLIIVDDAHWLDEASALLAADLLALQPMLQMLVVGRAPLGQAQTMLAGAVGDAATVRHTLAPLDRAGTAALAAGVLGTFDPAHPLVDWLHERARGNPLFARELLQALPANIITAGLTAPGAWREAEAQLRGLDLPHTIEDAAVARMGAQPLGRLGILKAASVVGGSFGRDILRALGVPVPDNALDDELAALVDEGLLVVDGTDGQMRWRFTQALVRDTVYASLPERMRVELHRKAVEYLESLPSSVAHGFSDQIAHHWLEAGVPTRALQPLRRAGHAATVAGAYDDAIEFFEAALDIANRDSTTRAKIRPLRRAQLQFDVCNAHLVVGDHHKALPAGIATLDGLWRPPPRTMAGWSLMAAREAALLAATIKLPAIFARDRRSMRGRVQNRLRCEVATRLSDCYINTSGTLPSLALSLYAARAAERAGDLSLAARPYGLVAYAAGLLRLERISRFCSDRSIADCTRKNNMFGLQRIYGGKLMLAVSLGRWDEAEPLIKGSFAFRKRYRSDLNHGMALSLAAQVAFMKGELDAARDLYQQLGALGYEMSDDQFVGWSLIGAAKIGHSTGAAGEVEAACDKGLAVLGRMIELQAQFIFEALRAAAIVRQGRHAEIAGQADALIAHAQTVPQQFASGEAFGALAEAMNGLLAALSDGDGGNGRQRAKRAQASLEKFARLFPIGRPVAALHAGQLACLTGDPNKAERIWRRGLGVAQAMAMRFEAARLAAALAALPTASAEARVRDAALAEQLATACGGAGVPHLPITPFSAAKEK